MPHPQAADTLQALYERSTNFFQLTSGATPFPTAAQDEFDDVPPGKAANDLQVLGLWTTDLGLVGVMTLVPQYPDVRTCRIGVTMVAPEYRGQGLQGIVSGWRTVGS